MKFNNFLLLFMLFPLQYNFAQLHPNSLLGLPKAASVAINATTPTIGNMVYNTDDNHAYVYTGTTFEKLLFGPNSYTGTLKISAAGTLAITGLPFQPASIVFEAHCNVEDFVIDDDNGGASSNFGIINSFGSMTGFARNTNGTINEQVIFNGGHGNSINNISRYASDNHCIGLRYGDQNGRDLGKITANLTSFDPNGFTLNVAYTLGTVTSNNVNPRLDVQPEDVNDEGIIVLYTAYR